MKGMSIDGPSRCALLDWLLKPLNLLQRKGSTKIDGNNQYVPAALFTSQKLFTSIFLFLFYHNPLLSSFLLFLLCHLLLVIPHPSANPPPPQAEQASLSHVVDLLSLILLTAIWAVCPRDSLALLGQWVQDKLSQVRPIPECYTHTVYNTISWLSLN